MFNFIFIGLMVLVIWLGIRYIHGASILNGIRGWFVTAWIFALPFLAVVVALASGLIADTLGFHCDPLYAGGSGCELMYYTLFTAGFIQFLTNPISIFFAVVGVIAGLWKIRKSKTEPGN